MLQPLDVEIPFLLKGKLFTINVLQLNTIQFDAIEQELQAKVRLAPQFFNYTPIIVDLQAIESEFDQINLLALQELLQRYNIISVGFRAQSDKIRTSIIELGLPFFKEARATASISKLPEKIEKAIHKNKINAQHQKQEQADLSQTTAPVPSSRSLIISKPIRSGQQVYAPDGDLIVLSSVSSGAELLAEGNIHVYGKLRGRALAGINGNPNAKIFCQKLEADLISIAGQYRLFEEPYKQKNLMKYQHIYLKDGQLVIQEI